MRQPTHAQAARRRLAVLCGVGLLLLTAITVVDEATERDEGPGRAATDRSELAAGADDAAGTADPEAGVPTASPSTTVPTGRFVPAQEGGPVVGTGPLHTYRVEVEQGSGIDPEEFGGMVEVILADPRGWTTADGIGLQRVPGPDADIVVTLATPATTDRLCFPLETEAYYSCAPDNRAIINLDRWLRGGPRSGLDLADYRRYVISHEVGHTLGHGHVECPAPGVPAPVMMQQTETIGDCAPNPWPVSGTDERTG